MTNKLVDFLKSKAAPLIVATGLAASVLTGCKETKTRYSNILYEDAIVLSKHHEDSYASMMGGMPVAFSEENKVDFDGKIDFSVDNGEIYKRFKEGDSVSVSYQEEYLETYDNSNGDGKKELVDVKPRGYIFIDAQPKGK